MALETPSLSATLKSGKMSSSFQEKGFTIENCNNGILIVKLNRPHKKNALKLATYGHLGEGKIFLLLAGMTY